MHEIIVAVAGLVEEVANLKRQLASSQRDAEYIKKDAVDALKREMEQSLVESDIKREVAIARLEAYERMNNKDDDKREIREMLKLAIQGLGSKPASGNQGKQQS